MPFAHCFVAQSSRAALLMLALLLASCTSLPPHQIAQVGAVQIAWIKSGTTTPVVVFQSGLGDGMVPWAAVIERLPQAVSYFAYDRPGYGSSGSVSDQPRDPCRVAHELRETLRSANVPPPYLLVGHSIGGQYQYAFAKLFPEDVAGMVLLDPTHPDHWSEMQLNAPNVAAVVTGLKAVAFSSAMKAEFDGQGICLESRKLFTARVPTRILVRTRHDLTETPAFRTMVERLEVDWLSIVPGATRRAVDGAGHYIQKDKPDVVADEIVSLLRVIQSHSP